MSASATCISSNRDLEPPTITNNNTSTNDSGIQIHKVGLKLHNSYYVCMLMCKIGKTDTDRYRYIDKDINRENNYHKDSEGHLLCPSRYPYPFPSIDVEALCVSTGRKIRFEINSQTLHNFHQTQIQKYLQDAESKYTDTNIDMNNNMKEDVNVVLEEYRLALKKNNADRQI